MQTTQTTHSIAFKEWASIVQALASGEQTLILRKGGIHEKNKKFEVSHHQFLFFPTYEHQNPEDLNERGKEILNQGCRAAVTTPGAGRGNPAPTIEIEYFFDVKRDIWVEDIQKLKSLSAFHVWSDVAIKKRFEWGEVPGLYVILGRVYKLPAKINLEIKPAFGGCRSWVSLGQEIPLSGMRPVLSDEVFNQKLDVITSLLKPN